jgi:hypothetical protein
MAKPGSVDEFKELTEQLVEKHKALLSRLRAEASALVDDYLEVSKLNRRALANAMSVGDGSDGKA